jgi:anti-sigma factor RsiW
MRATCSLAKLWMPGYVDTPVTPSLHGHLETCLGCQAEMAKYRRLHRELASLAPVRELAPAGFVAAVGVAIAEGVATVETPDKGYAAAIALTGATIVALGAAAFLRRRHVHSAS